MPTLVTTYSDEWLTGRVSLDLPEPAGQHEFDLVFVDRDGTLNKLLPGYRTLEDFDLLPDVVRALAHWNDRCAYIVVVTNQRGLARDVLTWDQLAEVHAKLITEAARGGAHISGIRVCGHEGGCGCRKPAPGMLLEVLEGAPWVNPKRCLMIGDAQSDRAAADSAGIPFLRVDSKIGLAQTLAER